MKKIILICFLNGSSLASYCQSLTPELLSTSGGYNLLGDVKMHWAVGEIAVSEHRNGIILTEGFFQAYADAVTDVPEIFTKADFKIYPNPAIDYLSIDHSLDGPVDAFVFDLSGQLIQKIDLSDHLTRINISHYQSGTYFMQVIYKKDHQATYSIIKL